jgi:class 3 adenylate cyclase/tetratricopeptide (TPR) repeat protein
MDVGRVVSVDRLVEDLWPGLPPETATHAVQVYVSQLRKALGHAIERSGLGYRLDLEPERVDVHRFARLAAEGQEELRNGDPAAAAETLRAALALWRGPALADFAYEPFAQSEIARLDELRTAVVEDRIEADLALGRHGELVSELEALVQAQALRERPRALLMLALYRSGRQADALATYRAARETLVEELGIEPGPELKELEAAILRQDTSLTVPEAAAAGPRMQFRRLASILFCDVVDSLALGGLLDAESLAGVQRLYFDTVSAAITRHGGTIEKYAGDAVMAAFGVPVAHEDDALRAARAAVDIQAGLEALNEHLGRDHGIELEARIGIAAGEVVATSTEAGQRFVAGDPVGIAARIQHAARPRDVVVGEIVARLIGHAARLEPHGAIEIKGREKPFETFRLLELAPIAPAFSRPDAALVGRKRELAALRRALKRAAEENAVQVTLVVAPPGVGKTRLAAELTGRTKRATALWGRCLSYGDGITYWPLREILAQAPKSEERDVVVAALEAETPPSAPELALLFRQACEALARERPLVLVLDDLHWAEPTFLELVEHLADTAHAPILVVGLARDELLEERPTFLDERANVDRIPLDVLTPDEIDVLLDRLGGTVLQPDQRGRIAEMAGGNPLFLEQLVALALEGGLTERPLPETIQSLLAARLDRLGPGERAVLERGAVVGKDFLTVDVESLLPSEAAPTAGAHLRALSEGGFLRSRGDEAFSFRHALVHEAVYRAAPKRLRAELHERVADRLDTVTPEPPELDELVGYHLERAYRLRAELGESDRRSARLAEDAGRRLGSAGVRALMRGDIPATTNLLERAVALLSTDGPLRRELLCDLGIAHHGSRRSDRALELLTEAIAESRASGDRRVESRARVELEYVGVCTRQRTADDLLAATDEGIPVFESAGDERALGRAWLLAAWARGGHLGDHEAWLDGAERALVHYRAAKWPTSTCLGEIAAALYWGPTPVVEAVARCEELLWDEAPDGAGRAYLDVFLGGLVAQQHEFTRARELVRSGGTVLADLGLQTAVQTYCAPVSGDIELLAGDAAASAEIFHALCDELERSKDFSHLASRASDLAEALLAQELVDDAEVWTRVAENNAARDDVNAQMMWRPIRARIHARRGELRIAQKLAREAVRLSHTTDDLNRRAKVHRDLGEVLQRAGKIADAVSAYDRAVELYVRKGNVAGAAQVRSLQGELAPA